MPRIIGVFSGKGGVGKTMLVSNLGISLVQEGYNVAVLDANLTGANLGLHLGLISYPVSIHDVMKRNISLTDAVYKHASGVDVIPASLSLDDTLDTEPVNIKQDIQDLLGDKDFILMDVATGLDRETLNAMEMCDEAIIVTHPELPTLSDALKTRNIADVYGKKSIGIVLNRIGKNDELKKDNISTFLELPVIGVIPEDYSVRRSIEVKNPIVLENPRHKISLEIRRISHYLTGKGFRVKSQGFFDRIRSFFH